MVIALRGVAGVFVMVGFVSTIGCGGDMELAEVEGTVKKGGQPLAKIQVEFWPVSIGTRSMATTDSEGRFKLMTDDGKRAGASIGSHKIVLHDLELLGDMPVGRAAENVDLSAGKKPRISALYTDPQKTTLSKEVVAGKKNEFDLEVTQ